MKHYTFYRERNDFDDILCDANLKNKINFKIQWVQHLLIGFDEYDLDEKLLGYIILKYGDDMKNVFIVDRTPIPHKDYIPKRN